MAFAINAYEKQFLKDYQNEDFENMLTQYRKKKIIDILANYPSKNILEIGCGMEPLFLVYEHFEKMVVIEAANAMYNSAVKHQQMVSGNIECIHDFVENRVDELQKQNFDFILLVGLIHEVEDSDKLMDAVSRICRENSYVLITTNNPNSFHLTLAYESGIIPQLGILTDKAKSFQRSSAFTMEEMKSLALKYGFSIVEEGSYFIKPFSHSQMKELLDRQIIDRAVLDGLDGLTKYIPGFGAENYCIVKLHKTR